MNEDASCLFPFSPMVWVVIDEYVSMFAVLGLEIRSARVEWCLVVEVLFTPRLFL